MLKAIETRYNGYRFRSRLEARWAVFFDTLGVAYEYEKEGFDLPECTYGMSNDGSSWAPATYYLPDFWLPQRQIWAEVKPGTFTDSELKKCIALVAASHQSCLLLVGPPDYKAYDEIAWNWCQEEVGDVDHISQAWAMWSTRGRWWALPSDEDIALLRDEEPYIAAVTAARSARFEHGERGR